MSNSPDSNTSKVNTSQANSDPAITGATAANASSGEPLLSPSELNILGDGLIAIANELHGNAAASANSLNSWQQWLEDEGYAGMQFCAALRNLCRQRLDAMACGKLLAEATARADEPDAIEAVIAHLNSHHLDLLDDLQRIEQTRQAELQSLYASAGGVNWKKTGIHFVEAAAVGTTLGLITSWAIGRRDARNLNRPIERAEQKADKMADVEVRRAENEARDTVTNVQQTSPEQRKAFALESVKEGERMQAVMGGRPFDIGKKASQITETDLLNVAKNYSSAHVASVKDYAKVTMEEQTTKLFHESSDLKKVLREHTVQTLKNDPTLMDQAHKDADEYADHLIETKFRGDLRLLEKVNGSDSFQAAYEKARISYQQGISNDILRGPLHKRLTEEYRKLITEEYNNDKDVKAMLGEAEDDIYQFRGQLKANNILDDLRLDRVPLERKIDMFCVGRVRKEAAGFEDYIESQEKAPEFRSMAEASAKYEEIKIVNSARSNTKALKESFAADFKEDLKIDMDDSREAVLPVFKTDEGKALDSIEIEAQTFETDSEDEIKELIEGLESSKKDV